MNETDKKINQLHKNITCNVSFVLFTIHNHNFYFRSFLVSLTRHLAVSRLNIHHIFHFFVISHARTRVLCVRIKTAKPHTYGMRSNKSNAPKYVHCCTKKKFDLNLVVYVHAVDNCVRIWWVDHSWCHCFFCFFFLSKEQKQHSQNHNITSYLTPKTKMLIQQVNKSK